MLERNKIRIVIDTNLWISFFLGAGTKTKLKLVLYDDRFQLLVSNDLNAELKSVLSRKKFNKINQQQIEELFSLIDIKADLINVTSLVEMSRDIKDNFILSLCKDGKVEYLLTGDEDLLILHPFEETTILKLSTFIDKYFNE